VFFLDSRFKSIF